MGEKEEAIKTLAKTLLKSGLATNPTESMEKAKASFGAEEILKRVQNVDPFLKEQKSVNEILNESEVETSKMTDEEPKTKAPAEVQINSGIQVKEIDDLDEEKEAEKASEEE